jgi:hypothetical protein
LQSFGEYPQVGGSVLPFRDSRSKQPSRKILKDTNYIYWTFNIRKLVVLYIKYIDTPIFVSPRGFKGISFLGLGGAFCLSHP